MIFHFFYQISFSIFFENVDFPHYFCYFMAKL